MEQLISGAAPDQLLLCMAAPIGGAIVFGLILFFAFTSQLRKKNGATKSSPQGQTADPLNLWSSAQPFKAAQIGLNNQSERLTTPFSTTSKFVNPTEIPQVNVNARQEEAPMLNLFKSPQNDKIDLAARLGVASAVEPMPPKPNQPLNQAAEISAPPRQTALPPSESIELLRLWREAQSGQLIVEIAGRRYTKLADITDKEIGQYILNLVAHLLAFTNGMVATDAGVKSLPAPKMGPVPLPPVAVAPQPPVVAEVVAKPSIDVEAAFLASLMQPSQPGEPQPQRRGLLGGAKPAKNEEQLLPPLNLAGQINRIVQARLLASSLAYNTKLEITSDLHGGIRINVNGNFYSSPDEIPNLEIRDLIKESIRQWEKSL